MAGPEPLPNLINRTITFVVVTAVVSSTLAIARLVVRYRINPKMGWSDYWIMCALSLSLTGHAFNIVGAKAGEGRFDADPFFKTARDQVAARKWVFFAGALNMYAMFFAKLSICAYLLALNFSRVYRRIIQATCFFVVVNLFVFPIISHWLRCNPASRSWDRFVKGTCWSNNFPVIVTSMQGAVNVTTDLIYAAAPILYLRRVKLSRYTRWGVRGVFLCALLGTALSITKVVYFARVVLGPRKDGLYRSAITSMLSLSENSVTIAVACLPPLRRTFDNLLMKILPERMRESIAGHQAGSQNLVLPSYYSNKSKNGDKEVTGDTESAKAILPDEEYVEDANGRIIRTTKVTITNHPSESAAEFGSDGQIRDPPTYPK